MPAWPKLLTRRSIPKTIRLQALDYKQTLEVKPTSWDYWVLVIIEAIQENAGNQTEEIVLLTG